MIVYTVQGMKEIKRLDYATDIEFYRAIVLLKYNVVLPFFTEKIVR